MKKHLFVVGLFLCLGLAASAQSGLDDQYVKIYNLIQQGDALQEGKQADLAIEKFTEAQALLKKLQTSYPNWNEKVVGFRIRYVTERINTLKPLAKTTPKTTTAPAAPGKVAAPAPVPAEAPEQLAALQQEVQRLQTDRSTLEAKLKEALSAQPAAADPREFAKAEERIRVLQKENEILKVSLTQEKEKSAKTGDPALMEQATAALADSQKKLAAQAELVASLRLERDGLVARLNSLTNQTPLAAAQPVAPALPPDTAALASKVSSLEKELADAKKLVIDASETIEKLQKEKSVLVARLVEPALASALATSADKPDAAKARRAAESASSEPANTQIAMLRARLEVLEARAIPYTAEELALFKQPAPPIGPPAPATDKKSPKLLPSGAAALVSQAERAFGDRRYDDAESLYRQVLKMDEKNVFTLTKLATIQAEQNRLVEAELSLKRALAEAPEDSFSLSMMGAVKFKQAKYDEALEVLSKSARLDPNNSETQNYLGITLSQKGLRGPAETALRKAVQLSPGYASAHHNLAVVYATAQPPSIELARWHYQKALDGGHPKNPDLEKVLNEKPPTN